MVVLPWNSKDFQLQLDDKPSHARPSIRHLKPRQDHPSERLRNQPRPDHVEGWLIQAYFGFTWMVSWTQEMKILELRNWYNDISQNYIRIKLIQKQCLYPISSFASDCLMWLKPCEKLSIHWSLEGGLKAGNRSDPTCLPYSQLEYDGNLPCFQLHSSTKKTLLMGM